MKKLILFVGVGCITLLVFLGIQRQVIMTQQIAEEERPIATIEFSNGEVIKMMLYPEEAPNTVENFIYLAKQGFYEGTYVNRIIPGYLVQAGDPIGNGYGYPGYFIASECRYNGVKNKLSHTRGTVSMARSSEFNTEGSQFFVLLEDDRSLNGQYSAFGRIIEGIEVLEKMTTLELDSNYQPKEPLLIEKISVEIGEKDIEYFETVEVGE